MKTAIIMINNISACSDQLVSSVWFPLNFTKRAHTFAHSFLPHYATPETYKSSHDTSGSENGFSAMALPLPAQTWTVDELVTRLGWVSVAIIISIVGRYGDKRSESGVCDCSL